MSGAKMPGKLRHNFHCPVCSKKVIAVFHSWEGSRDKSTFEYLHHDESEPCVVTMPYMEGLLRDLSESANAISEATDGIHR